MPAVKRHEVKHFTHICFLSSNRSEIYDEIASIARSASVTNVFSCIFIASKHTCSNQIYDSYHSSARNACAANLLLLKLSININKLRE